MLLLKSFMSSFVLLHSVVTTARAFMKIKEFDITVTMRMTKGSWDYTFHGELKFEKRYRGLIDNILNMSAKKLMKWQMAEVPDMCRDKVTDFSQFFANKVTAKYRD